MNDLKPTPAPTADWPIYNCHIHTFTKKHTPHGFIFWVLADAKQGRISLWKTLWYLLGLLAYGFLLISLGRASQFLAARPDSFSSLGYSFVIFFQAVLVIPILLLVIIIAVLIVILVLQVIINLLLKLRAESESGQIDLQLTNMKEAVTQKKKSVMRSNLLFNLLVKINPASNDIFERTTRFLKISEQPSQEQVFEEVERQYPEKTTVFVVLPMDMQFMKLGRVDAAIEKQHAKLLELAQSEKYRGQIIPFYAADPRHEDIVQRVEENLSREKFQGIKIYPNLGYRPDHPRLMEIYKLCMQGDFPVMTHCSPGGIWQYGLPEDVRRDYSHPLNYKKILDTPGYQTLKFCLAHFGGADEWIKHLKGRPRDDRTDSETNEEKRKKEQAWVRTIYEMIASGEYPNLYTDISYTIFTPKVQGLYLDLIDYLKVLMTHPLVRRRVLFGSDYYMVERESISEKEASVLLRSRLGEDLYKQIAYTNPREFLCIEDPAPARPARTKKASTNGSRRRGVKSI